MYRPVIDYHETLLDRKVLPEVAPGYLRELLPSTAPQEGEDWGAIQKDLTEKIVPGLTHW